jgi:putative DNA primase/helicase
MADMQNAIKTIGNVKLIIIDPIVNAVTGDSHNNSETRRDLQPVVDLGLSTGAAVLGITHLTKGGASNDPVARMFGTVAFTAMPRLVMIAAKTFDVEGNDCNILVRGKSNIGPDGDGFEYCIEQTEPTPGIHASRIIWRDSVQGSARELIRTDSFQDNFQESSPSQITIAREQLKTILMNGPVSAKEIEQRCKDSRLSLRTVRSASTKIGIIKRPSPEGPWFWSIPSKLASEIQGQSVDNLVNIVDMTEVRTEITA